MDKQNVSASTLVRVSVTDLDYHTAVEYSQPYNQEYLRDSLFACYAGYRCEVEIAGFARYAWIGNLGMMDYLKFSVPLLFVLFLCILDHLSKQRVIDLLRMILRLFYGLKVMERQVKFISPLPD